MWKELSEQSTNAIAIYGSRLASGDRIHQLGGLYDLGCVMAVFAIVAIKNPAALLDAVKHHFGTGYRQFADNVWLVADSGSSKSIADKLQLTDGKIGATGMVITMSGYSGYAPTDNWTWLKQYPEARSNG